VNDRERQIYTVIQKYAEAKGYPPSVREICGLVGFMLICKKSSAKAIFRLSRANRELCGW